MKRMTSHASTNLPVSRSSSRSLEAWDSWSTPDSKCCISDELAEPYTEKPGYAHTCPGELRCSKQSSARVATTYAAAERARRTKYAWAEPADKSGRRWTPNPETAKLVSEITAQWQSGERSIATSYTCGADAGDRRSYWMPPKASVAKRNVVETPAKLLSDKPTDGSDSSELSKKFSDFKRGASEHALSEHADDQVSSRSGEFQRNVSGASEPCLPMKSLPESTTARRLSSKSRKAVADTSKRPILLDLGKPRDEYMVVNRATVRTGAIVLLPTLLMFICIALFVVACSFLLTSSGDTTARFKTSWWRGEF